MSCNTWTFKKVSAMTDEEKRRAVNDKIDMVSFINRLSPRKDFIERKNEGRAKLAAQYNDPESFPPYTEDDYENEIARRERMIERLRKDGFDYLVKIETDKARFHKSEDGTLYWCIGHDIPFRVRTGYPGETFYEKQSLIDWLRDFSQLEIVGFYDEKATEPDKYFVEGYTPELERRIDEFFAKHGEDNLYFHFG